MEKRKTEGKQGKRKPSCEASRNPPQHRCRACAQRARGTSRLHLISQISINYLYIELGIWSQDFSPWSFCSLDAGAIASRGISKSVLAEQTSSVVPSRMAYTCGMMRFLEEMGLVENKSEVLQKFIRTRDADEYLQNVIGRCVQSRGKSQFIRHQDPDFTYFDFLKITKISRFL